MNSLSDMLKKSQQVQAAKAKESASVAPTATAGAPKLTLNLGVKPVAAAPAEPASGGDSFDDLDLDSITEQRSNTDDTPADVFEDQIPVEKPLRALPESITDQQKAFIALLDSVYDLHHDANAIKTAVQSLMIDMRETPHLADLVEDNDVTLIVRRMSQILGYRKVSETKKKTSRSTSKKSKASSALASELDDLLGGLGI